MLTGADGLANPAAAETDLSIPGASMEAPASFRNPRRLQFSPIGVLLRKTESDRMRCETEEASGPTALAERTK
jgi:hypothetical protein